MKRLLPILPALGLMLTACQGGTDTNTSGTLTDTTTTTQTANNIATVRLEATEGNNVTGYVNFMQEGDGLRAQGTIENLPGGTHGIHIHEGSSCDDAPPADNPNGTPEPAGAAGPHWDPMGTNNHAGPDAAASTRHAGDMGNITAGEDGRATLDVMLSGITLEGQNGVVNRTVVVHANEDDLTSQPSGNSGARIACGVIELEDSGMMNNGMMGNTTPGGVPGGTMDAPSNPATGSGESL